MKQLSGLDHAVPADRTRSTSSCTSPALGIYDPSTAPGGNVRFKDVLRFFSARIAAFPALPSPAGHGAAGARSAVLGRGGRLDVEFHVRHIALPQPGDWRQLCIQVARLHSRPLDRSKPLWEVYVIEGLAQRPDGRAGRQLRAIHESASLADRRRVRNGVHARDPLTCRRTTSRATEGRGPDRARGGARSLRSRDLLARPRQQPRASCPTWRASRSTPPPGSPGSVRFRATASPAIANARRTSLAAVYHGRSHSARHPTLPPATRFSGPVSAHRVFEACRAAAGRTEGNPPAGGRGDDQRSVHHHRRRRTQPLSRPPRRAPGDFHACGRSDDRCAAMNETQDGNRVGMTLMPLHSEIADPLERLAAIRVDAARPSA